MKFGKFLQIAEAVADNPDMLLSGRIPFAVAVKIISVMRDMDEEEVQNLPHTQAISILKECIEELKQDTDFLNAMLELASTISQLFTTSSASQETAS